MPSAAADHLRTQLPAIMERWDERVRAEVPAALTQERTLLRNNLSKTLEVLAKVLIDATDPRTAARDLKLLTVHGGDRAAMAGYSLEQMILECQILQEVVLEFLEPEHLLSLQDRSVVVAYFGEMIRVAAGAYARIQHKVIEDYAETLEKADKAKDEFLAMLGHELRNPIGAASNASYILQQRGKEIPALQRPLAVLERQLDFAVRLVDDLLDIARITQGKVAIENKPVALDAVVASALRSVQSFIQQKGLHYRYEGDPDVMVQGDAVRLEQVVSNLLGNAVKFTETGTIHVSLRTTDGEAVLRVRDPGIGISPEMLPRIFDIFSQSDRSLDRSEGGLGLGLTLVRRLVEMHAGTVEAKSAGAGKGCVMTVRLPLLSAPSETQVTDAAPSSTETQATVAKARPFQILVADDNVDAAVTLVDILESWGHHVTAVYTGAAAIEAVKADRPDALILDIGLPDMDGYAVARWIRAHPHLNDFTLIALTGYGQEEDRRKTREAGFQHHLVKPVNLQALERLLAEADNPRPAPDLPF